MQTLDSGDTLIQEHY